MIQITLEEHDSFPPKEKTTDPETIKKIKNLKDISLDEQDQKLQNILKDVLSISIDPVNNTLQFKANSRIGFAQFSKFAVEITPKFSGIKKLMELMNYVYNLDLKIFEESETMFVGEQNCVSEIIISSFVKKCHHLFRQGLVKSYDLREDNLPVLRGKLSLSRQILNQANTKLQFACEYDEFEHNNLENQIILFCLKQSYYVTKNEERKNEIRQLLQIISNLVIFREIRDDDFDKISYNQMNTHYKKIHELCKLIVHNTQITDFNNQRLRYINSFFVDMNTVFQKFIFKLFDDFYPHTVKEEVEYGSWETE
ncbi:MAG: hypothetical protein OXC46_07675, partial [Thaumarchaeota archaeon]|nr:hypothetical protein [Nitrososphaerota archaeon]